VLTFLLNVSNASSNNNTSSPFKVDIPLCFCVINIWTESVNTTKFLEFVKAKCFHQRVEICSFNKHQRLSCVDSFSLFIYLQVVPHHWFLAPNLFQIFPLHCTFFYMAQLMQNMFYKIFINNFSHSAYSAEALHMTTFCSIEYTVQALWDHE
jgi:hypothetical protein